MPIFHRHKKTNFQVARFAKNNKEDAGVCVRVRKAGKSCLANALITHFARHEQNGKIHFIKEANVCKSNL